MCISGTLHYTQSIYYQMLPGHLLCPHLGVCKLQPLATPSPAARLTETSEPGGKGGERQKLSENCVLGVQKH